MTRVQFLQHHVGEERFCCGNVVPIDVPVIYRSGPPENKPNGLYELALRALDEQGRPFERPLTGCPRESADFGYSFAKKPDGYTELQWMVMVRGWMF